MADSITNLLKQLPQDEKAATEALINVSDIQTLLHWTQRIEMVKANTNGKIDTKQYAMSLLYQLLCYLILNDMGNAKYLWKRLPKELRADSQAVSIWGIGQSMWKSEYSHAFELIDAFLSSQATEKTLKPFVKKLCVEYRRRCLELVTKSYSSITVKELLGYVSNLKNKSINGKDNGISFVNKDIINDYNLNNIWSLNSKDGIITIKNSSEKFDLDASLMDKFTRYVVFMEAQQGL